METTTPVPLKVINSQVPQSGAARDIYKSGRAGRQRFVEFETSKQTNVLENKKQQEALNKLRREIAEKEKAYKQELAEYEIEKKAYGSEYKDYEGKFKTVKKKEEELVSQLPQKPKIDVREELTGATFEQLLFDKNLSTQEQNLISDTEKKLGMSLGYEAKKQILDTSQLQQAQSKIAPKDFGITTSEILEKEDSKAPETISEKGLAIDKKKYIEGVEKELGMSLSPSEKERALENYIPTRAPWSKYIGKKIKQSSKYVFPSVFKEPRIITKFFRGGIEKGVAPITSGVVGVVEPGFQEAAQSFKEKGFKKGGSEIGLKALAGSDVSVETSGKIISNIKKDTLAFKDTVPTVVTSTSGPGKFGEIKAPKEELSSWTQRPTPSTVSAISTGIVSSIGQDLKEDPYGTIGGFVGSALTFSATDAALAKPFTRVMSASYNVGQGLKTNLGFIKPVYTTQTPSGYQAIKVQKKGLTKTGVQTRIANLGYKRKIQGVITKDALGRESIPVIINGRPRMIYLTKGAGEIPYSSINTAKTVKAYKPYLDDMSSRKFKELLTTLKTTKSNATIKNISKQIKNIDTKYGKNLPEVYTKQAKRGFGESYIKQEFYVGQFGSLGTAQRNLYNQFSGTGKEKFLKVGKPADNPLESSLFLSPYDPQTKSILLRKSRLGVVESPTLFSGKGFTLGSKTSPEAFVTKGTRVQDIPSSLKSLSIRAKTSSAARAEFAKKYLPYQLQADKGVQPFGYVGSGESEFTLAMGSTVKTTGQIGKIYVPGATTYAKLYDLSIPTTKEIIKKTGASYADDLLGATAKSVKTISQTTKPVYSTTRLASEIGLSISNLFSPKQTPTKTQPFTTESLKPIKSTPYKPIKSTPYITTSSLTSNLFTSGSQQPTRTDTSVVRGITRTEPIITPSEPRTGSDEITSNISPEEFPVRRASLNVNLYDSKLTTRPVINYYDEETYIGKKGKRYPDKRTEVKIDIPFNTFVREGGKWNKIDFDNKKRNKYAAMELGIRIADNTAARSWKVEKGRGSTVDISKKRKPNLNKFYRMSKTQDPKLAGAWIEKATHAIDTPGEMAGITAKGWVAERKRKFVKNYLSGRVKRPKRKKMKVNKIKAPRFKSVV